MHTAVVTKEPALVPGEPSSPATNQTAAAAAAEYFEEAAAGTASAAVMVKVKVHAPALAHQPAQQRAAHIPFIPTLCSTCTQYAGTAAFSLTRHTCLPAALRLTVQAAAANPQQAEQRPGTASFGSSAFTS